MPLWWTHAITVFGVIFLLELPDKTALATVMLATRHRAVPVFSGVAAAFFVQSLVAVIAGSLLSLLPREPVRIGAGVLFIVMAALVARRSLAEERRAEEIAVARQEARWHRAFLTAFSVIFVAEWGDLSQLATAALQARYKDWLTVFSAATIALWTVTALAVMVGNRLGTLVPERPLQLGAAAVMVVIGGLLISGVLG
jgi:putative Ca2+/H+ antiporter (TMEM165/GDT1 family)